MLVINSKIFEKLIFARIYDFLDQNCLLNINQSGFGSGNSCLHRLIAITRNIFTALDANLSLEVHGIEFGIKVL